MNGQLSFLKSLQTLADALAKICKAIQNLPKENMLVNFSSNLLVSSSVLHRVGILSTHPRLDTRLRNISAPKPNRKHWSRRNTHLALVLSMFLIISAVAVSLAMVDLQVNFTAEFTASRAIPTDVKVIAYHMGPVNITMLPAAPFGGGESIHVLIYSPNLIYRNSYAETGNNADLSMQEIVAGEFFIMHSQNSSIDPMQAAVYLPGGIWMG